RALYLRLENRPRGSDSPGLDCNPPEVVRGLNGSSSALSVMTFCRFYSEPLTIVRVGYAVTPTNRAVQLKTEPSNSHAGLDNCDWVIRLNRRASRRRIHHITA